MASIEQRVRTPTTPDYVFPEASRPGRMEDGFSPPVGIPLGDLTDEQIRELGAEMTEAMLRTAERQRGESDGN